MAYEPWLHSDACLTVKFEDLYPAVFELRNGKPASIVENMLRYLEIDESGLDLKELSIQVHGQSVTEISKYRSVLKDQHYALLDNSSFRQTLSAFGYQW